jgi:uncharacterized protein YvpB
VIGQAAHQSVAIASAVVVGTFGVAGGGGSWLAAQQQDQGVVGAVANLRAADRAFFQQVTLSLADGTPADKLADLEVREARIANRPPPQASFFVDRSVVTAVEKRSTDIRRLTVDVELRELDVAGGLNKQLRDLLTALSQDLVAARNAGIDTSAYDLVYRQAEDAAARQDVPRLAQKTLDDTQAQDEALKSATAAKVAADTALQAARDNATYQRRRAVGDLAEAQAIPVLDVRGVAVNIADLENRFPGAKTVDDFNNFAAAYAAQAAPLETLLYARSNAYSLLASARQEMARAQGAGADVGADSAAIADLSNQLDRAGGLVAIQAVAGQLSFIIRDLVGLYFAARSRPFQPAGAIIDNVPFYKQIYSLSCEEAALQMALAYYGVNVSQDQVLAQIGVDRRLPYYDRGTLVWGDPYTSFVGNPNGYESADAGSASGYGTYYSTIAAAARAFLPGSVVQAGEGIPPDAIFAAAHNRQAVVVWAAFAYQPHPMHYMRTFGGRTVMYGAPWEHAVTISGWAPGYVLINNPHSHPEWIDAGTFMAAYGMFNNMAVIMDRPPPPSPPAAPAPGPSPSP